ncbi:MAG: MarC family protein [Gemmatimonadales bacterium]
MPVQGDPGGLLSLGAVFTLFFVTLGPLKVVGPFAAQTREFDRATTRRIAVRAFVLAVVAVLAGGFGGRFLMQNWRISVPAMMLSGGLIFLLVGLQVVLEQYRPAPAPPPLPGDAMAAAMRVTFPTLVTPYGIAALIVMLANTQDSQRAVEIVAILLGVMVLNLLAMLFAHRIVGGIRQVALQILGAVLGVLQVALAAELILRALQDLGAHLGPTAGG